MSSKFTRRQWAAVFATLPVLAQSPQPSATASVSDVDEARARISSASKELTAFAIPIGTEPAFQFKA